MHFIELRHRADHVAHRAALLGSCRHCFATFRVAQAFSLCAFPHQTQPAAAFSPPFSHFAAFSKIAFLGSFSSNWLRSFSSCRARSSTVLGGTICTVTYWSPR